MQIYIQNVTHEALFVTVNIGNVAKSLNQLCFSHMMEYYTAIKITEDDICESHVFNWKKKNIRRYRHGAAFSTKVEKIRKYTCLSLKNKGYSEIQEINVKVEETRGGEGHFSEYFCMALTFGIMFIYSKQLCNNEIFTKPKMECKQKQINLTVYQINDIISAKEGEKPTQVIFEHSIIYPQTKYNKNYK